MFLLEAPQLCCIGKQLHLSPSQYKISSQPLTAAQPEDCLIYGALEMHESPEVAILQHASGVMQVANNAFENGITYFTNLIYLSIQFAVGNGDAAPFVGHNAFLRWKAVQAVSFEEDGMRKFWSDSHVSEDFDISLRMQMNKFLVRLATYHQGEFKEGVSLTVYDELARWEKYVFLFAIKAFQC
jgi:hypothetical protein